MFRPLVLALAVLTTVVSCAKTLPPCDLKKIEETMNDAKFDDCGGSSELFFAISYGLPYTEQIAELCQNDICINLAAKMIQMQPKDCVISETKHSLYSVLLDPLVEICPEVQTAAMEYEGTTEDEPGIGDMDGSIGSSNVDASINSGVTGGSTNSGSKDESIKSESKDESVDNELNENDEAQDDVGAGSTSAPSPCLSFSSSLALASLLY